MNNNLRNRKAYIETNEGITEIPFMKIQAGQWFMLLEADDIPVEGPIWYLARSDAYEIETPEGTRGWIDIEKRLYDATNT